MARASGGFSRLQKLEMILIRKDKTLDTILLQRFADTKNSLATSSRQMHIISPIISREIIHGHNTYPDLVRPFRLKWSRMPISSQNRQIYFRQSAVYSQNTVQVIYDCQKVARQLSKEKHKKTSTHNLFDP